MNRSLNQFQIAAGGRLVGELTVPGDKSISHRSIMFGSLAEGTTTISGFLEGEDSLATLKAFKSLGVEITGPDDGRVVISGVGMHGLKAAQHSLDLGNSGTSMRLMAGLLCAQDFDTKLVGDKSLSGRPMQRIIDPLTCMGANISSNDGKAPLALQGSNSQLKGIHYTMPMASAQVKSCLLLAGLYAEGKTCIEEPGVTRDHTERMLETFQYPIEKRDSTVCVEGGNTLIAGDIQVPADISSAAFFLVGASIAKDSNLLLKNVGVNPTRDGVIDILKLMGADISLENERMYGAEPVADIRVKSSDLSGIKIPAHLVPLAIDEFPALFIAAACAKGETVLSGASELRVKESDRIQAMADGLHVLGIEAEVTADGLIIQGGEMGGGEIDSCDDHRIAMAFAIAALRSRENIQINHCANVATSFPNFVEVSRNIGLNIMASA
ncbi:MAG TPA: 3-phosphoshikimate 1-carboxyvinyltransferase [Gammaproteobacteria bacterium]|nr:3-phosphoshikimate 1-carboxyvinyltransferase [Gammaproteobacteria bacterium]